MNLAEKILTEKIDDRISFIKRSCIRPFDEKIDTLQIHLSPRQFSVIKKNFNLKEIYELCRGQYIDTFEFSNYSVNSHYNERLSIYELTLKHKDYIEDFEDRENYIDSKIEEWNKR